MGTSEAQLEAWATGAKSKRSGTNDNQVDIALWWDVKDKKEAFRRKKHIELESVKMLKLEENMFSTLPTGFLELADAGNFAFNEPLQIGRELFIEIQLGAANSVAKETEPLLVKAKIEKFIIRPNMSTGGALYDIDLTLNATAFVNNIITYPAKTASDPLGLAETSVEAIRNVAGLGGLPVASDIMTYDSMHWINNNLSCKDFVDKIVNHSWIGEDDATIFFTTLDGYGHYTSIKTLTDNQQARNIVTESRYREKMQKDGKKAADKDWMKANSNIIAQDFKLINVGSRTQNIAGGIHQAVFYDNGWGAVAPAVLAAYNEKASAPDIQNVGLTEKPNTRYVRFDGQSDMIYMGGQSNNDSQVARSVREKQFAGVHFDSTHLFYDFAEANNKAIKMGFFQQFWKFTVDTKRQLDYFFNDNDMIPHIGDVCYIDFDIEKKENRLYTGRYLVTKIEHVWGNTNSYSLIITVCADGLHLENKKCKYCEICKAKNTCRYIKQFEKCDEYKKIKEKEQFDKRIEDDLEIAKATGRSIKSNTGDVVTSRDDKDDHVYKGQRSLATEKAKPRDEKNPTVTKKTNNTELTNGQINPWNIWTPDEAINR